MDVQEFNRLLALLALPADELQTSGRLASCIRNSYAHMPTVRDIVTMTEAEFLRTRGVGRTLLRELNGILGGMGLSLGMDAAQLPGYVAPKIELITASAIKFESLGITLVKQVSQDLASGSTKEALMGLRELKEFVERCEQELSHS